MTPENRPAGHRNPYSHFFLQQVENMSTNHPLLNMHPQEFVRFLRTEGIRRFHLVHDAGAKTMTASHPQLQPLADFILTDQRDFMEHEGAFFQVSNEHDTLQGAFVHRTRRGQAAGGVRYWQYETMEAYLRDGLRLAAGMTFKNALAGLWWGGGKGVMAHNPAVDKYDHDVREEIYREFGELMTAIRGCYVTAEDVGTHVVDMANVFACTRFTTCIPQGLGGSGNPSVPTARGVVAGMEAALAFLGEGTLEGKTVAVQGMGNVAAPLIRFLLEKKVKHVTACDINPALEDQIRQSFPDELVEPRIVGLDDLSIFAEECDILAPCACGAVLNPETIPMIRARIVCGAANNQLEDGIRDDKLLHERGILYVPDFLTNRMGIVNCANEQDGSVNHDPMIERHLEKDWEHSIHQAALRVFEESKQSGNPPAVVALAQANALSMEEHPLTGHRGQQIIDSLAADRWYEEDN
jgi:leucine dehydrogenase